MRVFIHQPFIDDSRRRGMLCGKKPRWIVYTLGNRLLLHPALYEISLLCSSQALGLRSRNCPEKIDLVEFSEMMEMFYILTSWFGVWLMGIYIYQILIKIHSKYLSNCNLKRCAFLLYINYNSIDLKNKFKKKRKFALTHSLISIHSPLQLLFSIF